jgi:hypothetical protein
VNVSTIDEDYTRDDYELESPHRDASNMDPFQFPSPLFIGESQPCSMDNTNSSDSMLLSDEGQFESLSFVPNTPEYSPVFCSTAPSSPVHEQESPLYCQASPDCSAYACSGSPSSLSRHHQLPHHSPAQHKQTSDMLEELRLPPIAGAADLSGDLICNTYDGLHPTYIDQEEVETEDDQQDDIETEDESVHDYDGHTPTTVACTHYDDMPSLEVCTPIGALECPMQGRGDILSMLKYQHSASSDVVVVL